MNRVIRACVLWVMVVAMPVQALAAATMLFCGPGHQRMAQGLIGPQTVEPSEPAASAIAAGVHLVAHHAAGHHAGAQDVADAGPGHAAADADWAEGSSHLPSSHHDPAGCSACAACCPVLAPPARIVLPATGGGARGVQAPPLTPVQSFQPDGPDRPPRALVCA